eukprot:gene25885-32329_t
MRALRFSYGRPPRGAALAGHVTSWWSRLRGVLCLDTGNDVPTAG